MKRILTTALSITPALALALAACSSYVGGSVGHTKDEARAAGGVDENGKDICAVEGWYDDGTCDDFCPQADGDCQVSDRCPSPDDPHAHYVSERGDYTACAAAPWACGPNQIPFDSPECGCGCVDVAEPGPMCGGFAGIACDPGFFCNYPTATMCGSGDQAGTCEPIPDVCPANYDPVCGCDGVTYSNACDAHGAGVSVLKDGACGGGSGAFCGGFAGFQCAAGEFCSYALEDMCGAGDQGGTCAPRPEACDKNLAPVCGCDAKTYGNECEANAAGVAIMAHGECPVN